MGKSHSKAQLSTEVQNKALEIFRMMDKDGSKTIDKDETLKFWKSNFAKLNTEALFKAVDADGNGRISEDEWIYFWSEVKSSGHSEKEILEELDQLKEGKSWVSFDSVPAEKHGGAKNKKNY